MRGYLTFHRTPEAVKYYFPKSARVLTGTIFVRNAERAYDRFARYVRDAEDNFFHITLSLPTGMTLSRQRWRTEIDEHLRARGANPVHLPWLLWKDTSTVAEHIHLYGLLRTFDGRRVHLDTSRRTTDRAHRDFARRLGVADPAPSAQRVPQLTGRVKPKGGLPLGVAEQVAASLNHAVSYWLPSSVMELNKALYESDSPWRVAIEYPDARHRSIRFHREFDRNDFALSRLGPDFYPSEMFRRLDFAGRVKTGRALVQLKQTLDQPEIQSQLKKLTEMIDARTAEFRLGNYSEQPEATNRDDGRDRGEGRGPTSTPQVASEPGSHPFQLREAPYRTADRLRSETGVDGTDHVRSGKGPAGTVQAAGYASEHPGGTSPRVTLFEWLRSILYHAARIGRFWYTLKDNRKAVKLVFEDETVASVTSARALAEGEAKPGMMAGRFATSYQNPLRPPEDKQVAVPSDKRHEIYDAEDDAKDEAARSGPSPETPSPFD